MKQYISWEHYEAEKSRTSVWEAVGFGLVWFGVVVMVGLAILIF